MHDCSITVLVCLQIPTRPASERPPSRISRRRSTRRLPMAPTPPLAPRTDSRVTCRAPPARESSALSKSAQDSRTLMIAPTAQPHTRATRASLPFPVSATPHYPARRERKRALWTAHRRRTHLRAVAAAAIPSSLDDTSEEAGVAESRQPRRYVVSAAHSSRESRGNRH